ncbi:hypothetical protein HNQ35_000217 [Cerasibacillus quisquiliarum]|uniref:DUF3592 domain-containing protein n=1 Tax=Cerasibacillus quisquiliarum TaxID=227865 RepID=A0A511UU10_9BACI|nr:DUF3592 domain-containing protein [Cerasibacillus quisquiliarum]MBB5145028.1 hypothetical protein [Cerasibacillus quisquiliarum]GEN30080.1 hypothetical protein CQU01_03180 [Cerasibacillus quisquiliarum]
MEAIIPSAFLSGLFLLFGIIFFLIGWVRKRKARFWHQTTGIIVKKERSYVINLGKIVRGESFKETDTPDEKPTVQYNVNGKAYQYTSNITSNSHPLYPGEEVNLLYNPENPNQAMIDTFIYRGTLFSVFGIAFMSISLVIFAIGLYMYVFS